MSTENLYAPKRGAEEKVGSSQKKTLFYFYSVLLLRMFGYSANIFSEEKYMNIELDAKKMVRDFGGMTSTARLLTEAGVPITRDAVDKWRRAKRIPSPHLLSLALIAKERGQRFDVYDYIIAKKVRKDERQD